jgi:hypothetical protein
MSHNSSVFQYDACLSTPFPSIPLPTQYPFLIPLHFLHQHHSPVLSPLLYRPLGLHDTKKEEVRLRNETQGARSISKNLEFQLSTLDKEASRYCRGRGRGGERVSHRRNERTYLDIWIVNFISLSYILILWDNIWAICLSICPVIICSCFSSLHHSLNKGQTYCT